MSADAPPPPPALRLRDLRFRRAAEGAPLFEGLSLDLVRGEALVVLGPSGGGKTTLLKLVNRLLEPEAGEVAVLGRPVAEWSPTELRRSAVLVSQTPVALGGSVRDELTLPLQWASRPADDDALRAALTRVGLSEVALERDGAALSGGQQARLGLARALLLEPPLLLLDEPTASLDVRSARELLAALRRWCAEREVALLAVSHRLEDAVHLGARAAVLEGGRLHGPFPGALLAEGADRSGLDPAVRAFLSAAPAAEAAP